MDMVPPMDDDMGRYPHVFITADGPWNPDVVDEEFFFDATDAITDIPCVQPRRDAREGLDLCPASNTLVPSPSEPPITQA